MRIVGAIWTPQMNQLVIRCDCGEEFHHRADRWKVWCLCGAQGHLSDLRERYVAQNRKQQEVVIVDPRIVGMAEYTYENETGGKTNVLLPFQVEPGQIERSRMDEIKALIGDANARISVSADFGIKDYGTGASAMCTVSLTCNQDTQTMERTAQIAGELARGYAQEQRQLAENELTQILAQRGTAPMSGTPRYGG